MGRIIYSDETCVKYLKGSAVQEGFSVGLVLGQTSGSRETVIHLTRTPEEKNAEALSSDYVHHAEKNSDKLQSILGVSEVWVADHARHVTRMLPGGMFVQGIFIITPEDIFKQENLLSKAKSILMHIYKCLESNVHMYGNCPNMDERLILHWSTISSSLVCKSVPIGSNAKNTLTEVDWKIVSKGSYWQRLNCFYEFDEVYPIVARNNGVSVKQQFNQILERTVKQIQTSVMFIDGDLRQDGDILETLGKKKKSKSSKTSSNEPPKSMNVSIFIPFENSLPDTVEYLECEGNIHFSGVVASCVFMHPKATVSEAITAVKQDIIRSLASRFTMHCDALIDDNLLPEEKVCFNEPPRRVLVPLRTNGPDCLYLCDYLFPGESPAEALVSVKELLDLQLNEDDVVADLETPADTSEFDTLDRDTKSEEMIASPQEASQFMYIAGIGFAFFVLIVSIIIHYYQSIVKFFS